MSARVEHGDCRELIPQLVAEGVVVDAVVTDPPYHLSATVKRLQSERIDGDTDIARRARKAHAGKALDDGLARMAGGFMGQRWDGGDIAFRPETWATIATALRPGGFLLAFGGTRTFDRVWGAIRESGLVVQDTILWLYGSGFPKRRDMLKPAWEPICVAYKPGGKRTLQVNECRIGIGKDVPASPAKDRIGQIAKGNERGRSAETSGFDPNIGRWPANIAHDGSDEVMAAFAAFGERNAGISRSDRGKGGFWSESDGTPCGPQYGDSGSAARFFFCGKADGEDRWGSRHPTVKPVELLKWLVPLVTPPGGTFLDPFAGSGTAAVAALASGRNAILVEQDAGYVADIRERVAYYQGDSRHSLATKARHRQSAAAGTLL